MPTLTELQERYTRIDKAIGVVEDTGQSYSIGNQTYAKGDLRTMYAERSRVEQQITVLTQRGRLSHATTVFGGRR